MAEYRGVEVFGRQSSGQSSRRAVPPRRRSTPPTRRTVQKARLSPRLGLLGLGAALVTATSTVTGISLALVGKYEASILLAYLATGA